MGGMGEPIATVTVSDEREGITATGGMCVPLDPSYNFLQLGSGYRSLFEPGAQVRAAQQMARSCHDPEIAARLHAEFPDPWAFTASRGGIRYIAPPGLTVDPDGTVHGYIAAWPKMSKLVRLRHRTRVRLAALRVTVGDWISGRDDEAEYEDRDW